MGLSFDTSSLGSVGQWLDKGVDVYREIRTIDKGSQLQPEPAVPPPAPPKAAPQGNNNKTLLYVGAGVAVVALVFLVSRR